MSAQSLFPGSGSFVLGQPLVVPVPAPPPIPSRRKPNRNQGNRRKNAPGRRGNYQQKDRYHDDDRYDSSEDDDEDDDYSGDVQHKPPLRYGDRNSDDYAPRRPYRTRTPNRDDSYENSYESYR